MLNHGILRADAKVVLMSIDIVAIIYGFSSEEAVENRVELLYSCCITR